MTFSMHADMQVASVCYHIQSQQHTFLPLNVIGRDEWWRYVYITVPQSSYDFMVNIGSECINVIKYMFLKIGTVFSEMVV
jgi:hypothetical protein